MLKMMKGSWTQIAIATTILCCGLGILYGLYQQIFSHVEFHGCFDCAYPIGKNMCPIDMSGVKTAVVFLGLTAFLLVSVRLVELAGRLIKR